MEVTYALGVEMLLAAGVEKTSKKARHRLENALGSGLAAEKFERVIEAQGGNPKVVEDASVLPQAQEVEVYNAPRTGDRKSTRLNSSHSQISYAVFCLKKKN